MTAIEARHIYDEMSSERFSWIMEQRYPQALHDEFVRLRSIEGDDCALRFGIECLAVQVLCQHPRLVICNGQDKLPQPIDVK